MCAAGCRSDKLSVMGCLKLCLLGILDKFYSLVGEDKTCEPKTNLEVLVYKQACMMVPLVLKTDYKVTRI